MDQGFFVLDPCGFEQYGVGASPVNYLDLDGAGTPAPGAPLTLVTSNVPGLFIVTVLSLDSADFPLFGGVGLFDPFTFHPTTFRSLPVASVTTLVIPVPNNPNLVGKSLFFQAFADDALQPQGLALSNGLRVTFCSAPGP